MNTTLDAGFPDVCPDTAVANVIPAIVVATIVLPKIFLPKIFLLKIVLPKIVLPIFIVTIIKPRKKPLNKATIDAFSLSYVALRIARIGLSTSSIAIADYDTLSPYAMARSAS
jgi:hypothetical protein